MSQEWIECSSSAPPPAWARSARQLECPGTTEPVGQNWSSRIVYAIGAPRAPPTAQVWSWRTIGMEP